LTAAVSHKKQKNKKTIAIITYSRTTAPQVYDVRYDRRDVCSAIDDDTWRYQRANTTLLPEEVGGSRERNVSTFVGCVHDWTFAMPNKIYWSGPTLLSALCMTATNLLRFIVSDRHTLGCILWAPQSNK
jgi:hypothetical protein